MIHISIIDINGSSRVLEIDPGVQYNLMEILKREGYEIVAACGGMALCGTCVVEVISGLDTLAPPLGQELDILDTLPNINPSNRCSCQLHLDNVMDGMTIKILRL